MKKKELEDSIDAILLEYTRQNKSVDVGDGMHVSEVPTEVILAIINRGLASCPCESEIELKGSATLELLPGGVELIRDGGYAALRKKRRRKGVTGAARWVAQRLLGLLGL